MTYTGALTRTLTSAYRTQNVPLTTLLLTLLSESALAEIGVQVI